MFGLKHGQILQAFLDKSCFDIDEDISTSMALQIRDGSLGFRVYTTCFLPTSLSIIPHLIILTNVPSLGYRVLHDLNVHNHMQENRLCPIFNP
jgi:hypothetical protein